MANNKQTKPMSKTNKEKLAGQDWAKKIKEKYL